MSVKSSKPKHYFIHGTDEFEVKRRADALVEQEKPGDSMNLEIIHATADSVDDACKYLRSAIEALQTLPFFGGRKLIYLKQVNFAGDSPIGRSEAVLALFEKVVECIQKISPEQAQLIMSAIAVDKRRVFYKSLSSLMSIETFDRADLTKNQEAAGWQDQVAHRLREAGLKPQPGVVERLVDLAGSDSRILRNEIEKLALYCHPSVEVDEAALRAIGSSSRETAVWDLCGAITAGKVSQAVQLLHQLFAQGESEFALLILIGNQVRMAALSTYLHETKRLALQRRGSFVQAELLGDGEELLGRNRKGEKPNLFFLGKVFQQAQGRSSKAWFKAIEMVHAAHQKLMSGGLDRRELLETTVTQLATLV